MPAWIGAGASIIGDLFSSSGQDAANAQNLAIAQMNNQFNAQQASLNRDFQAGQATLNRNFQAQQTSAAEAYQTDMSNTAEQRRVTDLKAAGLNPLLAATAGAASAPTISAPSGSMPSGSQASSAGNPRMENTMAAMGNLGGQVSSAMQAGAAQSTVASQIAANTAQARLASNQADKIAGVDTSKTAQDTATSKSQEDLNRTQSALNDAYREIAVPAKAQSDRAAAALSQQQIVNAQAQIPKIQAEIENLRSATDLNGANKILATAQSFLVGLNANQVALIMPDVAAKLHNEVQLLAAKLPAAEAAGSNLAAFETSWAGKFNPLLHQTILPIVNTAVSAAAAMKGMMPAAGPAGPVGDLTSRMLQEGLDQ